VELDLVAFGIKANLLAELPRKVAHQARKPFEHLAYRSHAGGKDLSLHAGNEAVDSLTHFHEHRITRFRSQSAEAVLRYDQLANLLHQQIQPPEIHPDLPVRSGLRISTGRDRLDNLNGLHIADCPERGSNFGVGRPGLQPEGETAVEVVPLEFRQSRPYRIYRPHGPRSPQDQRGPRAPHHRT